MSMQGWQYVAATCTSDGEVASVWAGTVFASKLDAAEDMVNDIAEHTEHEREGDSDELGEPLSVTHFINLNMYVEHDANDLPEMVSWDETDAPHVWRVVNTVVEVT